MNHKTNPVSELALLQHLSKLAKPGTWIVSKSDFENALEIQGFVEGEKITGKVITMCKLTEDGKVDCSRLALEVTSANSAYTSREDGAKICESKDQIVTNVHIDQKSLVLKLSPKLREIFVLYDNAEINAEELTKRIEQLGIKKTSSYENLIRHAPYNLTFMQLVQALTKLDEPNGKQVAGIPGNFEEICEKRSRRLIGEMQPKNDQQNRLYTKAAVHGNKPGAQKIHIQEKSLATRKRNELYQSHLFDGQSEQKQASLFRRQVYACVKALDNAEIGVEEFMQKLDFLNCKVPCEVEPLLAEARVTGNIHFTQFIRAFEPIILEKEGKSENKMLGTAAVPNRKNTDKQIVKNNPNTLKSTATLSHGDLISWSSAPGTLEEEESKQRARICKKHISAVVVDENTTANSLEWTTEEKTKHKFKPNAKSIIEWQDDTGSSNRKPVPFQSNIPYGIDE